MPLSALFLGLGAVNFVRVARILGVSAILLVLPPLVYLSIFGVLYSEAHLFYFCLSWLTLLAVDGTWGKRYGPVLIGFAAALVFLARLDSVFFVAAFYGWLLLTTREPRRVLAAGATAVLLAVPYLASNILVFGGLVPVQGWLKSSFPRLSLSGLQDAGSLSVGFAGYSVLFGILPLAVAALAIVLTRPALGSRSAIVYAYLAGGILHFGYIAFFYTAYPLWYWYYVVPVTLLGLAIALAARRLRPDAPLLWAFGLAGAVVLVAVLVVDKGRQGPSDLETAAVAYLEENAIRGKTVLVSDLPGRLAYYTDNHIVAADMFTANRGFVEEMWRSEDALAYLFEHARRQGKPIEYILLPGTSLLRPSSDGRLVELYHYRDLRRRIGAADLGDPIYSALGGRLLVWRVPQP